jgi:hypothetical protein
MPPGGASTFELHRFSPLFEQADELGLERLGAYPIYQYIFPVAPADLDELVYRHDYRLRARGDAQGDPQVLQDALAAWNAARERGAALSFALRGDDTAEILDTRGAQPVTHRLSRAEALLYRRMDAIVSERALIAALADDPAMRELADIAAVLAAWLRDGLIAKDDDKLLALAVNAIDPRLRALPEGLRTPIGYLEREPRRLPVVS